MVRFDKRCNMLDNDVRLMISKFPIIWLVRLNRNSFLQKRYMQLYLKALL